MTSLGGQFSAAYTHAFVTLPDGGSVDIGGLMACTPTDPIPGPPGCPVNPTICPSSYGLGVNAAGQVVGYGDTAGGSHGFLSMDGVLQDLNDLLTSAGWTVTMASAINDAGQIAATAVDANGLYHAVLLTPSAATPEPATWTLFGAGLVLVWARRRTSTA